MIGLFFSTVLFFVSMFFLFKGALVTAAGIMGFSLLWYLVSYIYHRHQSMMNYFIKDKEENS